MNDLRTNVVLLTAELVAGTALGFSSDGSSAARSLSAGISMTNASVVVTVTFTNAQTNAVRGWFYSDQVPDGLSVSTLSVKIEGRSVTNYLVESGPVSDVYPGCKPWRWALEQPPEFRESNPISASGSVEIVYAVSAPAPGSFALEQYSWGAWVPITTNACFGHSENTDQQTVAFIDIPPPPHLDFSYQESGFELSFEGIPGAIYIVEGSTNLTDWISMATNTTTVSLVDTNSTFCVRFYRAVWRP